VGQIEVSGGADLFGAIYDSGENGDTIPLPPVLPNLELSGRFGVVKDVDLQLRLDTFLYPEVAVGYQFLGSQLDADSVAASVAIGGRFYAVPALGGQFDGNLSVPVMVLVDIPIGPATLTLNSRNIVGILVGQGGSLSVTPGFSAAATFPYGDSPLFLRTEIGANYPILLAGEKNLSANAIAFYGGSIGIGYTFGTPKALDASPPKTPEP
jgi:hypothetical protein